MTFKYSGVCIHFQMQLKGEKFSPSQNMKLNIPLSDMYMCMCLCLCVCLEKGISNGYENLYRNLLSFSH